LPYHAGSFEIPAALVASLIFLDLIGNDNLRKIIAIIGTFVVPVNALTDSESVKSFLGQETKSMTLKPTILENLANYAIVVIAIVSRSVCVAYDSHTAILTISWPSRPNTTTM
jgi:hypothetical protein